MPLLAILIVLVLGKFAHLCGGILLQQGLYDFHHVRTDKNIAQNLTDTLCWAAVVSYIRQHTHPGSGESIEISYRWLSEKQSLSEVWTLELNNIHLVFLRRIILSTARVKEAKSVPFRPMLLDRLQWWIFFVLYTYVWNFSSWPTELLVTWTEVRDFEIKGQEVWSDL